MTLSDHVWICCFIKQLAEFIQINPDADLGSSDLCIVVNVCSPMRMPHGMTVAAQPVNSTCECIITALSNCCHVQQ